MREGNKPALPAPPPARSSVLFVLCLFSIAANILFACVLLRKQGSSTLPPPVDSSDTTISGQARQGGTDKTEAALPPELLEKFLQDFHWSTLQTADYKEYAAHLRAFGTPEPDVRTIIMGEIHRIYWPKIGALRKSKGPNPKFWENRSFFSRQDQGLTAAQQTGIKALEKEQKDLAKSVFGPTVFEELARDAGYREWADRQNAFIPEDKRQTLAELQERFGELKSDVYSKVGGYFDSDAQDDLKKIERQWRDELQKVLSPEEFFEYELRNSELSGNLRSQLEAFEPNEQEFRAIYAYKEQVDGLSWSADAGYTPDRQQALKDALGADRFKEYNLLQDGQYQNLAMAGVSREAILGVADTKTQTEEAAGKIRNDPSLTSDQRTQALQALHDSAASTLSDLLGARRARAYMGSSGYWIRNIAPKPEPVPSP